MDFFDRQEKSRRRTSVLLVYFIGAIIGTAAMVYLVAMLLWFLLWLKNTHKPLDAFDWWNLNLFLITAGVTLLVILAGSIYKVIDLRRGGSRVAELLGGRRLPPNADEFYERRLLNVVEEMAIASGTSVPSVYVLYREKGINAFAAGYTPKDAVVAVTYGTLVGLTREELQGVIAHEFSHILNGDMRLNLHLMGGLHGLLLIVLAGRSIFEMRVRGRGSLYVYLVAGALFVVGSIGLFFGKLIQSAISRQREFLADAAAVQFTRNPEGLAGALKKIGGLTGGSRILAPQAAGVSHMFFGNALRASSLATHPPLADRVRWLQPEFNGTFERVTLESLYKQLEIKEGAPALKKPPHSFADALTRPADLAVTGAVLQQAARRRKNTSGTAPRQNPDALMATIGAPLQEHVIHAEKLLDAIPEDLKELARDPYGCRAVIYLLLIDSDESVRPRQMEIIQSKADAGVIEELKKILPHLKTLAPEMKLPIFDLAVPALRQLSKGQYLPFRANLRPLIDADEQVSVFEYALQRVLICNLDPLFGGRANRQRAAGIYAFCGVQNEVSCVLSVLARLNETASVAFEKASEKIPDARAVFMLQPGSQCGWEQLDQSLDKLAGASFYIKKWVLAAALVCLMSDRDITVEEVELFRAIADSLGCPVPPWLAVTSLGASA
ncbi:M48 family metallopeptidase [Tichowtungia aerotolerans]|uniref:M48 family metalloprotease n=1 Tax=Tichowtungia aerotolerans TaxID=2697043 RepID=A0A6P1M189_9BACT|nr:M48 family metallopeptidase [Tichowtungia aerotolerans]QHI68579.1 M48 family metalloprotease [Tichowtungia aerotolerans]